LIQKPGLSPIILCHRFPDHLKVVGHPVLGRLHSKYELVTKAAWIFSDHKLLFGLTGYVVVGNW
jgi:hypothetical protein